MLLFSASLKKQKTFRRPGFLQWFQFFEMCLRPTENVMKAIFCQHKTTFFLVLFFSNDFLFMQEILQVCSFSIRYLAISINS